MRFLVSGSLVAVSFIAGWQIEHSQRLSRLADLKSYEFCGRLINSSADGYYDIMVRDRNGNWRTLAFAAQAYQGHVKVRRKDERFVAMVESELRYRKTLHPGVTYVCDKCANSVRHEAQQPIIRSVLITSLRAYECPICRLRIRPMREHFPARENWRLISDFRGQQRFFPTAPKVDAE